MARVLIVGYGNPLRGDDGLGWHAAQDGPPGMLSCRRIVPEPSAPGAFSHHLTPFTLVVCVETLYDTCPEALVLSVVGAFFGYGEQLSPAVQAALPTLVAQVQVLVVG